MKDQFRSKKRIKKGWFYKIILLFFVVILFFIFSSKFVKIFSTAEQLKEDFFSASLNTQDLILENNKLKKELEIYKNPENLFYFYKKENEELKKRLGYAEFFGNKRKIFHISKDKSSSIYGTFLFYDKSNFSQKGDLVFYKFNLLIGKILEKKSNLAKVQLFSNIGAENTFYLYDGGELKMQVSGIGQGSGIIKAEAPREIIFKNTDKVFLVDSKNDSYLVAKMVDKKFKIQDSKKVLYFKVFANPNLLSQVEIQKNNI